MATTTITTTLTQSTASVAAAGNTLQVGISTTAAFVPTLIPAIILENTTALTSHGQSIVAPSNLVALVIILGIGVAAFVATFFTLVILRQLYTHNILHWPFEGYLVQYCTKAVLVAVPLAAILISLPLLDVADSVYDPIQQTLMIIFIAACTYTGIRMVKAIQMTLSQQERELEESRHGKNRQKHIIREGLKKSSKIEKDVSIKDTDITTPDEKTMMLTNSDNSRSNREQQETLDDQRSRTIQTQLVVFARVADALIIAIGIAAVILTFPSGYSFGTSLLASAGVAGVVFTMAAKGPLSNLVSSLQLAMTSPILLDDYVCFDGKQGYIEEIQSQYVVVRQRTFNRVIVPIQRFTEGSFENRSRMEGGRMATFTLYVGYGYPIDELRRQLQEFANKSPYADGKVVTLVVSDMQSSQTLELKATLSCPTLEHTFVISDAAREYLAGCIATRSKRIQVEEGNKEKASGGGTQALKSSSSDVNSDEETDEYGMSSNLDYVMAVAAAL